MLNKALFLDRDGVINIDYGYVHTQNRFVFIDGIFDLVFNACKHNYLCIVVTNQAGIARGYYSESQFKDLSDWMCHEFNLRGGKIQDVYYCPFHPESGTGSYKFDSDKRKPAPGMLLDAKNDYNIDMSNSILIGDKYTDILAGQSAGVGTLLYFGNETEYGSATKIDYIDQANYFLTNKYKP